MDKTPELMALEFAEIIAPYRPWVDQVTHQQDEEIRRALQIAWLEGFKIGRKLEWLVKKETRGAKLR